MKIIGGKFRGRNFYRPEDIRPTQNIARKALFDMLGHELEGVVFLDLFAGSGAVGLEALSRGVQKVVFVEKDAKCAEIIRENLAFFDVRGDKESPLFYEVINSDAFAVIKVLFRQEKKFDVVFCDPPFGRGLAKKALKTLEAYDIVQPNCIVVIQHEKEENLPDNEGRFRLFRRKKYGSSIFSMYDVAESQ